MSEYTQQVHDLLSDIDQLRETVEEMRETERVALLENSLAQVDLLASVARAERAESERDDEKAAHDRIWEENGKLHWELVATHRWAKAWKRAAKMYRAECEGWEQDSEKQEDEILEYHNDLIGCRRKLDAAESERDAASAVLRGAMEALGEEWPMCCGFSEDTDEVWRVCPECKRSKRGKSHFSDCTRGRAFAALAVQPEGKGE